MATNLSIDPVLLANAIELSGEKTEKATVNLALREFIARREQMRLRDLFGQLEWSAGFDYKRGRIRRCDRAAEARTRLTRPCPNPPLRLRRA